MVTAYAKAAGGEEVAFERTEKREVEACPASHAVRTRKGLSSEALVRVLHQYGALIRRRGRQFFGDDTTAEDVLMEVLLRLWERGALVLGRRLRVGNGRSGDVSLDVPLEPPEHPPVGKAHDRSGEPHHPGRDSDGF